ncbi:UPF0488 protein CG14286 [Camponotus floridanus]|uniref:UPF0488 protein CG14286 n=1 Tax=Camponotus floridanus TaxID=104421 RepID=E2AVU6_CAMFO|nr:UPF0488 protein CG14286 [Camponotus floridanus]EFN62368.1 UPF0488 protein CG14286 [Camponotus floridanus]
MPLKSSTNNKRSSKNKKSATQTCILPEAVDANSASGLNLEMEDKFELELCWCIQQLEASLASGKLHNKQAQDLSKQLHSLKSNTAPLVKKRQIMRNALGNYREKMAEDERKLSRTVSAVKFTSSASANKKSMFIRKAIQHDAQDLKEQANDDHKLQNVKQAIIDNRTQIPFQFNF